MKITYIDRETKTLKMEKVAGEKYIKWLYSNPLGMGLLELLFKRKIFSYFYGKLQDWPVSKRKINSFIAEYGIEMEEYKKAPEEFSHFNDFFYRELKEGARKIDQSQDRLVSPGDGRLFAYADIDINSLYQIKGSTYSLIDLIEDRQLAQEYYGGVCFILRLCPVDYHRFHFPCSGVPERSREIKGSYYSVNPLALRKKTEIYCQNKRHFTLLHSDRFNDVLIGEIGATCVGSIVQTFKPLVKVEKGAEKGYFKFGGSTVIMFLKAGQVKVDEDLINNTKKGLETKVKMGMGIGTKEKGL